MGFHCQTPSADASADARPQLALHAPGAGAGGRAKQVRVPGEAIQGGNLPFGDRRTVDSLGL